MNADGSNQVGLTEKYKINATGISWTPDSQQLLFNAQIDNQSDVFLLSVDDAKLINLTNNPANDYDAIWWQSN